MPLLAGILILLFSFLPQGKHGSKLVTQNAEVSIFAPAVLEPIKASNQRLNGELDISTKSFRFTIQTAGFVFKSKLMERHFNEEYLETHLFPEATFEGNYLEMINLSEDGEYDISASGTLTVHGVSQKRNIPGKVIVENGKISVFAKFIVRFDDHKIKIPTLFFNDYATQVEVSVNSGLILINEEQANTGF
jgi:polyisoprenoid-binding protein YceI